MHHKIGAGAGAGSSCLPALAAAFAGIAGIAPIAGVFAVVLVVVPAGFAGIAVLVALNYAALPVLAEDLDSLAHALAASSAADGCEASMVAGLGLSVAQVDYPV
jgi:hypothetical protein